MSDGIDAYRLRIEKFEEDDVGKPLNADPAKTAPDLGQRVGVGRDSGEDHIDRRAEASREIRVNARITPTCRLVFANSHILESDIHSVCLSRHLTEDRPRHRAFHAFRLAPLKFANEFLVVDLRTLIVERVQNLDRDGCPIVTRQLQDFFEQAAGCDSHNDISHPRVVCRPVARMRRV